MICINEFKIVNVSLSTPLVSQHVHAHHCAQTKETKLDEEKHYIDTQFGVHPLKHANLP